MGWLQRLLGRDVPPAAQPTEAPASAEPAWQQLAPIGGTFAPPELTLRPARFEAELTTRQKPGLIGSMLHDIAIDGPAGYVVAAAQPPPTAPAEGVVRFPPPPPQLSRIVASADAEATLPETTPQLLPSFPEPPPSGPSPVTAGELALGVMRFPVHDAGPLPGAAGPPPVAASPGSPSAARSSSPGQGAGPSAGVPTAERPSVRSLGTGDPSLPAPNVVLPGAQGAVPLPVAQRSLSGEDAVRSRSRAPQVPASQDAQERREAGLAPPPLTVSGGSTPDLVDPPAPPAPFATTAPPLAATPAVGLPQAHGGTAPGGDAPLTPRRLQRYRLGEPQTPGREAPVPPLPADSPMNRPPTSEAAAGHPPADRTPTKGTIGEPPAESRLLQAATSPSLPSPASPPPHSVVTPASPGVLAAPMSRSVPSLPLQARVSSLPPEAETAAAATPQLAETLAAPGSASDRAGSATESAPPTIAGPPLADTTGPLLGELPRTLAVPVDPALPPEDPEPAGLLAEPAGGKPSALLSEPAGSPALPTRGILAQRQAIGPASSPTTTRAGATTSPDRRLEEAGGRRVGGAGRLSTAGGTVALMQRAGLGTPEPPLRAAEGTVILFPGRDGSPAGAAYRAGETDAPTAQRLRLQRQDAPAAAVAPDSGGDTPAPAASPSGGSAPAAGAGPGDADLDELGRRLYDRIRDQLAAELAIDRERAGLLNDLGLR